MKILVIEDDEIVGDLLTQVLTSQNYAVELAMDGQTGWNLVEAFNYDLILLDILLPKLDGISLCRKIRSAGVQTPILLLTGCSNGHDKAIGLDAGADDYVVKPFDQEELVARIRALLRRGTTNTQPVLEWGDLRLDPSSCEVTYRSHLLALTPKEYALLELFLRNHRRVFSCSMILEHLWSYEEVPGEEAVRTHIKGLRQKLRAAGCPADFIETVYGIGYRLKSQEPGAKETLDQKEIVDKIGQPPKTKNGSPAKHSQAVQSEHPPRHQLKHQAERQLQNQLEYPAANPTDPSNQLAAICEPTRQQQLALINKVWHKFKDRIYEQIGVLEKATLALQYGKLEQSLQQSARQEAHTLAGALGTFGLMAGSQLSRQIESKFQAEYPLSREDGAQLQQWVAALQREVRQAAQSSSSTQVDERPLLLVIDSDYAFAEGLMITASSWGFRVEMAANLTRAQDRIYLEPPSAVLLDPTTFSTIAESQHLLNELQKHIPPVPVIICTAQADLSDRLNILHLGEHTFIEKPASPIQILTVVKQVLQQAERTKATVMVVDDDPSILAALRSLLEPWGLKIVTLDDPQQFWSVLEAASPDLLILDIEMPHINGIELCQIVRRDSRWSDLPVLILTAHTDAETINQTFTVGTDDFVSKPLVGSELVTRVINRLERIKLLRRRYTGHSETSN